MKNDKNTCVSELKAKLARFVRERDWEQYHSPKNLAMSAAIEAAELMEHFQWLTIEESEKALMDRKVRSEVEDELADIALYILEFCNMCGLDLSTAVLRKLKKNAAKYPVRLAKGKSHKYTRYRK